MTSTYGEKLYNSCKDVKFGSLNTRAMDFIGGGARNYQGTNYLRFCSIYVDLVDLFDFFSCDGFYINRLWYKEF